MLFLGGRTSDALDLTGFTDSDWGRDLDDRRSISGYMFRLGQAVFCWSSAKQKSMAHSSCDGEYMAMAYGLKQVLWLRPLLDEIGLQTKNQPTPLFVDNQAAIAISKDARFHSRTKHIDIRYHAVCQSVEDDTIEPQHVLSNEILADIATKPLTPELNANLLDNLLGMMEIDG